MDSATLVDLAVKAATGLILAGGGAAGLAAWQRFRGERASGQLIVKSAEGIVVLSQDLLKNMQEQMREQGARLAQVEMECAEIDKRRDDCEDKMGQMNATLYILQKDVESHTRMSELARRKTHAAINALGNYELLLELNLEEMRKCGIMIEDRHRSTRLRQAFQDEMNKLENLESKITEQALTNDFTKSLDNALRGPEPDAGQDHV